MQRFYTNFYAAVEQSQAHAEFCREVFGRNLCQHGFADLAQLDALMTAANLGPGQVGLDLGCGNGMIAEYISACTGAAVTGLDYIPAAIAAAQQRTAGLAPRLSFVLGDINALALPAAAFDVIIAIDSLYFSADYAATIGRLRDALRPAGRLAAYFSHGREPWVPREQFPAVTLAPDKTPLALALQANGMAWQAWDYTAEDLRLARRRLEVLPGLEARFTAEGNSFIYENRLGEARGVCQAITEGLHRRYLYLAHAAGS